MSNQYSTTDEIPSETLCARLEQLSKAVTEGKEAVEREFTMRVPAECDRDADLVLYRAAKRIRELEAKTKIKISQSPLRILFVFRSDRSREGAMRLQTDCLRGLIRETLPHKCSIEFSNGIIYNFFTTRDIEMGRLQGEKWNAVFFDDYPSDLSRILPYVMVK